MLRTPPADRSSKKDDSDVNQSKVSRQIPTEKHVNFKEDKDMSVLPSSPDRKVAGIATNLGLVGFFPSGAKTESLLSHGAAVASVCLPSIAAVPGLLDERTARRAQLKSLATRLRAQLSASAKKESPSVVARDLPSDPEERAQLELYAQHRREINVSESELCDLEVDYADAKQMIADLRNARALSNTGNELGMNITAADRKANFHELEQNVERFGISLRKAQRLHHNVYRDLITQEHLPTTSHAVSGVVGTSVSDERFLAALREKNSGFDVVRADLSRLSPHLGRWQRWKLMQEPSTSHQVPRLG